MALQAKKVKVTFLEDAFYNPDDLEHAFSDNPNGDRQPITVVNTVVFDNCVIANEEIKQLNNNPKFIVLSTTVIDA